VIRAPRPLRRWTIKSGTLYAYRLVAHTSAGRPRVWQRDYPPPTCEGWPWQPKEPDSFFAGAELLYLGEPKDLDADVYHATWSDVRAPASVPAGRSFTVTAKVRNTSAAAWRNRGGARVRLSYHWLDGSGATVERDGQRTELREPLAPGAEARVELEVVAPSPPGRYTLVLDPVFETVSWFSQRGESSTPKLPIDVLRVEPLPEAGH
jgi:hypothetical protein